MPLWVDRQGKFFEFCSADASLLFGNTTTTSINNNSLKPCSPACLIVCCLRPKVTEEGWGGRLAKEGRDSFGRREGVLKLTHAITEQMFGAIAISTFIECEERWPSGTDDLAYYGGFGVGRGEIRQISVCNRMQRGLSIKCNGCLRRTRNLSKQPYIRTKADGDVPWYLPHIFGIKCFLIAVRFKTLGFFLSGRVYRCLVSLAEGADKLGKDVWPSHPLHPHLDLWRTMGRL